MRPPRRIGVIGLGRLGAALVRGLARAGRAPDLTGYNRTGEKTRELAAKAPGFRAALSEAEVFETCDPVFLWTKPADAAAVLDRNRALVGRVQPLVVSCIAGVPLGDFTPRWAETYPNVALAAGRGVTPVSYPPGASAADKALLNGILAQAGTVYEVPSETLWRYGALTSCGPGLYAVLFETLADTLAARHGFDRDLCRRMVLETAAGTAFLQQDEGIDAAEVVRRVAHPGGSTAGGVAVLQARLPELYGTLLGAMGKG